MKVEGIHRYGFVALRGILFLVVVASVNACSSSKKEQELPPTAEAADVEAGPGGDAGTDAVPLSSTETLESPPAEGGAPGEDPLLGDTTKAEVPSENPTADPLSTPPSTSNEVGSEPFGADPLGSPSVEANAQSGSIGTPGTYTVQKGDTLMKIAFETYGDIYRWKDIYEKNRDQLPNSNQIPPGVTLKLDPPSEGISISKNGEKYQIVKGDTLGKISEKLYGTPSKWRALWKNNPELIRDANKIFAGFYLYYPSDPITAGEEGEVRQPSSIKSKPAQRANQTPLKNHKEDVGPKNNPSGQASPQFGAGLPEMAPQAISPPGIPQDGNAAPLLMPQ